MSLSGFNRRRRGDAERKARDAKEQKAVENGLNNEETNGAEDSESPKKMGRKRRKEDDA